LQPLETAGKVNLICRC